MKQIFISINKLNFWFWTRIVKSTATSLEALSIFRILTGIFLLLFNNPAFGWIGTSPKLFFKPPVFSIAAFFNGFPGVGWFIACDFGVLLCAVCVTLGIRAQLASLIYVLLNIFGLSFQYSFGKIDHTIILYAMLFCLSFSGWGVKLAVAPDRQKSSDGYIRALSLFSVILCFAFFSAGFEKAIKWINFDFGKSGTASWFYSGFYSLERQYFFAPIVNHTPFWVFKIMDFIAVPFEVSSIFFLLHSRKAWKIWLLIAALFHLTNLLVLNIPFVINAISYLAFVNFSGAFNGVQKMLTKKPNQLLIGILLACVVVGRLYGIINLKLDTILLVPDYYVFHNLAVSLIVWIFVGAILCKDIFTSQTVSYQCTT